MGSLDKADFIVDYLVVGAGLSGLAFTDELLTRTADATILIVDKRDLPGGHWNDSYPFVKLHQPSDQYGVESKALENSRVDTDGFNKGLQSLASGPEIRSYCVTVMRDILLASGRVTFLQSTEYLPNGTLRGVFSGRSYTVQINKKLVDASHDSNIIPLTHKRSFSVEENVKCIPPNYLPNEAKDFTNFTVLGAGKTGLDSCLWLLEQGVDPARIRWVIAGEYWYFNRAQQQARPETFESTFGGYAEFFGSAAKATNCHDYCSRMEQAGLFMRLDPDIFPEQFHAGTITLGELEALRRIKDIVRKGHCTKIDAQHITLKQGTIEAKPNTLYIDCTASGVPTKPSVPVFQPGKIVLQMIRYPLIPFSAAKTAFLESIDWTDEEKNFHAQPVRYPKNVDGFLIQFGIDLETRARDLSNPVIVQWLAQSRLDAFTKLAGTARPEELEKQALLVKMQESFQGAHKSIPNLIASLQNEAVY